MYLCVCVRMCIYVICITLCCAIVHSSIPYYTIFCCVYRSGLNGLGSWRDQSPVAIPTSSKPFGPVMKQKPSEIHREGERGRERHR